MLLKK